MNERLVRAPALNASDLPWFNVARPLDIPDLLGKITILDFWTYCCINCIHIIPTLKRIEEMFADSLVVIGVHSPKFPGEKLTENLEKAISRYEIIHPIVHDKDFQIWQRYAVRAWPTLVFIGPDGYVLGQLPGEPNPELLEQTLENVINECKEKGILKGKATDLIHPSPNDSEATLSFPGKIAYSLNEKEFAIADSNHNQIVTVNPSGKITRRIGSGRAGQKDGSFWEAEFFRPQGLCYHQGVIWVADTENHLIRKIELDNEKVITVAGTGLQGAFLKGKGKAKEVGISSPWDLSIEGDTLYFANAGTHQIGAYKIGDNTVEQFAGTGAEAIQDGPRLMVPFAQPSGLSIGEGKLFLADSETSAIRSINLDDHGFTKTYVGRGLFDFGDKDGIGKEAELQHPLGVHYVEGCLFIADSYNHKIKALDLKTEEVHTVEASAELICDEQCSRLWEPAGVLCLDKILYVSDTNNHRILKIDLDSEKTTIFVN